MLKPFDGWQSIAPDWVLELPRDRRGFPVPAEVPWQGDVPLLQGTDPSRAFVLGLRRRCAVCGLGLGAGGRYFRTFAQRDAARIRGYEREFTNDFGGPAHESCMLFSSMACPHLRDGSSTLGRANKINAGASRGTMAAAMGFESYSLLFPLDKPVFEGLLFGYSRLVVDTRYRLGDELHDRLSAAIVADRDDVVPGDRMFWTSSSSDSAALVSAATSGLDEVRAGGFVGGGEIEGRGRYALAEVPENPSELD